jgi:hypothetical protein
MQENQNLNSDEKELVESLSGLLPGAPNVSEQSIWFEAGRRTGRRQLGVWRSVAAAVLVLAVGIAVWRPKRGVVYVDRVRPSSSIEGGASDPAMPRIRSFASIDYVTLRDAVEQHGMEALPKAAGSGVISQPTQSAWSPLSTDSTPSLWDSLNTKG